jgi:outer membrane lipoprotein
MKKVFACFLFIIILFSCAPVLREEFMRKADFEVRFSEIMEDPGLFKGRLYILGGIIAGTTATKTGSVIEALYVPVNIRGYLKSYRSSNIRFLAKFPGRFLDPLIYREGREITLAGEFVSTQKGRIDEMDYTYPLFNIKELYLWAERKEYYYDAPYPPWHFPYWWYYPGWRYRYYYY